jgi:peptidyl-prolyl cis-trans isomerase C
LLTVLILACGLFDQTVNKVVLVVGSRHITTNELEKDIEFMSGGMEVPTEQQNQIRKQLVEQIIDHYLIIEYGKEKGISISEKELQSALEDIKREYTEGSFKDALLRGYVDFKQWKDRLRDKLLVNKIIRKVSEGIVRPSDQDIKRYFEENRDEFRRPQMVRFRQIVTRTKEEAENLLKRLHTGEEMSELAREYSIAPEADSGGNVGWVAKGHLHESMEKVLFSLPQGKISPVVKTPYGYHIFETLSVKPEGMKELPEVIQEIESRLTSEKRNVLCREWLRELRTHFRVKVDHDLLNTLEVS